MFITNKQALHLFFSDLMREFVMHPHIVYVLFRTDHEILKPQS